MHNCNCGMSLVVRFLCAMSHPVLGTKLCYLISSSLTVWLCPPQLITGDFGLSMDSDGRLWPLLFLSPMTCAPSAAGPAVTCRTEWPSASTWTPWASRADALQHTYVDLECGQKFELNTFFFFYFFVSIFRSSHVHVFSFFVINHIFSSISFCQEKSGIEVYWPPRQTTPVHWYFSVLVMTCPTTTRLPTANSTTPLAATNCVLSVCSTDLLLFLLLQCWPTEYIWLTLPHISLMSSLTRPWWKPPLTLWCR